MKSSRGSRAPAKDDGVQSVQMQPCLTGTWLHWSLAMDTTQEERGKDRAQSLTPAYSPRYIEYERAVESSGESRAPAKDAAAQSALQPCPRGT